MFLTHVFEARLDLITLILVSLASMLLVLAWVRRAHGPVRSPRVAWVGLGALLCLAGALAEGASRLEQQRLISMLQGIAPTYAEELELLGHEHVTPHTSADDPRYLAMIDAQRRWLRCNPAVADIYTFGRRADGAVVLLVDSETDYDRDGVIRGARESRTRIGEAWGNSSRFLDRAFAGEACFDPVPATDRWGTWVSAYVPMRDADGGVTAVLGVDYGAADWVASIVRARGAALGVVGILIVILIASACMLTVRDAELARRLHAERALRESEGQLRELLAQDRLTQLASRTLFLDRLEQAIVRAKRLGDYRFAVLFLDFDRFKLVNDSLGHSRGDELLQAIAQRLAGVLRETDTVSRCGQGTFAARLGGDEFVILLDAIRDHADATAVADRLLRALYEPYRLGEREIQITASIGITCSDREYESAEDMLRDADTAMYYAKAAGKARHVMFNPRMHEQSMERLTIETELRRAMQLEQLALEFQPIVRLEDGRITGVEALLRWNHPTRGRLLPEHFIPLAEETGLIVPIGQWVLREACRTLSHWRQQLAHANDLTISVNVSRNQFETAPFVQAVRATLDEFHLQPRHLRLEITESVIMRDSATAAAVLHELSDMGVGLVIDDFGTGYSSLSCLHRFPLGGLKIDRSFIASAVERPAYAAIVGAIVTLAANLNMELVAEGVEDERQLELLRSLGCAQVQGFYFSPPLPLPAVTAMLADAGASLPRAA